MGFAEDRRGQRHARGRWTPGHALASVARGATVAAAALLVGVVSTDGSAAPPEVASAAPVPVTASLAGGVVEHRALSLHGLPVRGAFERVLRTSDGTERVLTQRAPSVAPQLLPHQARLSASDVLSVVAMHGAPDAPLPADPPELVYRIVLGEPILVWEVQMPLQLGPAPTRKKLWVSAATGRVLDEHEEVLSASARVFAENPAVTPTPIDVELSLVTDGPGVPLDGPTVMALNCVDEPPEDEEAIYAWHSDDECYGVVGLLSDDEGDYFPPLPDIIYPEQSQVVDDGYAQLSMYYHAERFFERFAELGVESFACEKATLLANFHTLEPSGALEYSPLNNAYYTNECDIEDGPTMIFGQGTDVDYGYDGDVVYHELGHGLVAHLSPAGLGETHLRTDGALVDARGINESLADYFSIVLTEDPHLAEYVGRYSSSSKPFIRNAENTRVCPDNLNGQEHNDGEPMTAALWAIRKRVGGAVLDPLVLQMLMQLPPDATLDGAAGTLLDLADAQMDAGALSADEREVFFRSLQSRGLLDCPRVISDPVRVEAGASMYLKRRSSGILPFFPAPLQLRYVVPSGTDTVFVRFRLIPSGSTNPVSSHVLVRRADAPIQYDYHLVGADEEVELPDEGGEPDDPDPVREVISTTGDWDDELEPVEYATHEYEALIEGVAAGDVLHIAVVNTSTTTAVASSIRLGTTEPVPEEPEDDDEVVGETDGEMPPDGVEIVETDEVVVGGCTCRSRPGRRSPAAAWWLFAPLLLLGRRVRRGSAQR